MIPFRLIGLTCGVLNTLVVVAASAQQPLAQSVRHSVSDTSIFAPLVLLPQATPVRSANGAPGPRYWQNTADYDLRATLDTLYHSLKGGMTLRYTNHSPDTLKFLWLQTEQNAFKAGTLTSLIFPPDVRFGAGGFNGGNTFDRFEQVLGHQSIALRLREQGTITRVTLAKPLAPGQMATLQVDWHFLIPDHGADRMGRDGALYQIAQWFPRLCVYDDVRGWNFEPYLGQGEFYLEYGHYTLAVTVPAGYIVGATGMLTNAHDVLTGAQVRRLATAAQSDSTVAIITAAELLSGAARPTKSGTQTWKFTATNVRDMAWFAAPDYQWDAASWHGILTMAYYRPRAVGTWKDAANMTRQSIQEYSERWFRYPYPQATVVEGPVGGMEYPMVAMEGQSSTQYELFTVIAHEVGHNWFPMIVGSNERVHAWMDEGVNTFINTFAEARRYPERGTQGKRASYNNDGAVANDTPIEMPADRLMNIQLYFSGYYKPMAGLQILREYVLGPAAFDDALRAYVERWAFKHPTPADFYRTMEDVSGQRLDWFWRGWFIENTQFDQAIDTVAASMAGDTMIVNVRYGNHTHGVLPLIVRFTFSDGTTQERVYPADVWSTNSSVYVRSYRFGKRLTRLELDPDHRLADINRSNNVWPSA